MPDYGAEALALWTLHTASKGTAAAKAAASMGLAGAIFGPILGVLGGLFGAAMSIENTESPRERRFMKKMAVVALVLAGLFCVAVFVFTFAIRAGWKEHPLLIATGFFGVLLIYGVGLTTLIVWGNRRQRRIRAEEGAKPAAATSPVSSGVYSTPIRTASWEYRSRRMLLGLPLVHIRAGGVQQNGPRLPARGWIAIGETAYGALVGLGSQLAVAPISLGGGAAVGVIALGGGGAAGVLAIGGGAAAGIAALGGGLGVGLFAAGACAAGWNAAIGGMAIAHHYALGGAVYAMHANDDAARAVLHGSTFSPARMRAAGRWLRTFAYVPVAMILVWRLIRICRRRAKSAPQ